MDHGRLAPMQGMVCWKLLCGGTLQSRWKPGSQREGGAKNTPTVSHLPSQAPWAQGTFSQ